MTTTLTSETVKVIDCARAGLDCIQALTYVDATKTAKALESIRAVTMVLLSGLRGATSAAEMAAALKAEVGATMVVTPIPANPETR